MSGNKRSKLDESGFQEKFIEIASHKIQQEIDEQILKSIHEFADNSRNLYDEWAAANPQMDEGYDHFMEHFEPTLRKLREL